MGYRQNKKGKDRLCISNMTVTHLMHRYYVGLKIASFSIESTYGDYTEQSAANKGERAQRVSHGQCVDTRVSIKI